MRYTTQYIRTILRAFACTIMVLAPLPSLGQIILSSPNTLGEYRDNVSIILKPGFTSSPGTGQSAHFYISFQDCQTLNTAPSNSQNYMVTYVPRLPGITNPADPSHTNCEVMTSIQYLDGLGRPSQTIQVRGSTNSNDVVQPFAYDQYGRETVKYLPYALNPSAVNNGSFKTDALSAQAAFYNPATPGAANIATTIFPYAESKIEFSPLNRPLEQGAAGDAWQLTGKAGASSPGHTVKMDYATNNSVAFVTDAVNGRQVALYKATINADFSRILTRYNNNEVYGDNQLSVTVVKDENWTTGREGTTEEYKDKDGRVVLKRTFNHNTTTNATEQLSTYYVYDDRGNLAFVLPQGALPDNAWTPDQTALNNFCYQYRYDDRNRQVQKKIPGKGWDFTVYNKLDQPVATQDANQRNKAPQQWAFIKYDALGRPVQAGLWEDAGTTADNSATAPSVSRLQTLQGVVDAQTGNLWETRAAGSNYTTTCWPTTWATTLSINYYDNYSIPALPAAYAYDAAALSGLPAQASTQTKGLPTASKIAVLDQPGVMLWTVNYYDDEGHAIQNIKQHYFNGTLADNNYDRYSSLYNFTDAVTAAIRQHHTVASGSSVALSVANTFDYDHMGRKIKSWESINGATPILINQTDFNELGQVNAKHLHSTNSGTSFLQDIAYGYNERGWLQNSSAGLFAMQLKYNDGTTPQYNGNIANQLWGTPGNLNKNYTYSYDKLNRLTNGIASTGNSESNIGYDVMGNITSLTRSGLNAVSLSYIYTNGNQLSTVNNSSSIYRSYSYDVNGNATTDGLGNTINYNQLNLPATIPGKGLTYTYTAGGEKIKKVSAQGSVTTTTEYISGIQYNNGTLDFIQTDGGRAVKNGSSWNYEYTLADHLGNNRITFDQTSTTTPKQTTDYYPFGLQVSGIVPSSPNKYLYNGKEIQEELNQYDYGARFYDPVIGRWNAIDAFAEKYKAHTPYHYGLNDPISNIDLHGDSTIKGAGYWRNTWEGIKDGGASTKNFIKSLGTSQGWEDLGQGMLNMLPPVTLEQKFNRNFATATALSKIPEMDRDDWGHATGFGLEKIGEGVLLSKGAGITSNLLKSGLAAATTSEGFLFGSISIKLPFNLNVGLFASEKTLLYNSFKFSTIAPESFGNSEMFGRRMLQITEDFQPQLGKWSKQVIPAGTPMQVGLVGPQPGMPFGTWLQIYTPKSVPFVKP